MLFIKCQKHLGPTAHGGLFRLLFVVPAAVQNSNIFNLPSSQANVQHLLLEK